MCCGASRGRDIERRPIGSQQEPVRPAFHSFILFEEALMVAVLLKVQPWWLIPACTPVLASWLSAACNGQSHVA